MVSIKSSLNWNDKVLGRLKACAKVNSVSVGYPENATYSNGMSVGEVARIQEYGTPKIPPRPFIRPTIDSRKGHWGRTLVAGLKRSKTEDQLRKLWDDRGKAIVVNLQQAIDRVTSPALSDFTVQRRKGRGNNSDKPLIDSGKMRDELSYKVADGDWKK